jgi:hypothetical protein
VFSAASFATSATSMEIAEQVEDIVGENMGGEMQGAHITQ